MQRIAGADARAKKTQASRQVEASNGAETNKNLFHEPFQHRSHCGQS
jgi:hypothetical protein